MKKVKQSDFCRLVVCKNVDLKQKKIAKHKFIWLTIFFKNFFVSF